MPNRVTQVQSTPNQNAMKFILDARLADTPASFFNAGSAEGHALAKKLFTIEGVSSVLILHDFVTVNKQPAAKWSRLTPEVRRMLESG